MPKTYQHYEGQSWCFVAGILDTVSSDIQQVMGGKRAHPRSTIHLFRVILHLLGSVSFNHRVVTSQVLLQLANLMKILETPFKVSDILNEATVSQCFEFLLGDLTNANLQVVRRIGNLLEFATAKDMDDFLEPTLELCRAFIICGIGSNRSIVLTKEPALLVDGAFSMSIAVDQQSYIVDICDLGGSMGIFLEVVGNSDPHISIWRQIACAYLGRDVVKEPGMVLTSVATVWHGSAVRAQDTVACYVIFIRNDVGLLYMVLLAKSVFALPVLVGM
uniref:Uncharacterized protein n=1 Tax=Aegilops tauschii TaxID=37682 RepID=N1R592_AEGTA